MESGRLGRDNQQPIYIEGVSVGYVFLVLFTLLRPVRAY